MPPFRVGTFKWIWHLRNTKVSRNSQLMLKHVSPSHCSVDKDLTRDHKIQTLHSKVLYTCAITPNYKVSTLKLPVHNLF